MGKKMCLFIEDELAAKIKQLPKGRKSFFVEASIDFFLKSNEGSRLFSMMTTGENSFGSKKQKSNSSNKIKTESPLSEKDLQKNIDFLGKEED